eukprot:gb/GEZN01003952.1/.p1 GENE.gb/GEZN01003952.1/~~gb/GEZN01003952.1/.p1  ORF type:complete len:454 (+),score=58.44 gb/GEZN01003952.1/:29-1390(+)
MQPSHKKRKKLGGALVIPDWNSLSLVPFERNFYIGHPRVEERSEAEVTAWRNAQRITVTGEDVPNPVLKFSEAMFPTYIAYELKKANFKRPTAIQAQGWPAALSGRDVIGIADTGSGKTLAFLLPGIVHINAQPPLSPGDGPIVLILSPTRELAQQTMGECNKFGKTSGLKFACVFGGVPRSQQTRPLKAGVEVLIGTPGRLIDFVESGITNFQRVTYLVLDEADRMLDMGFERQVKLLCAMVRPDRQTLLWTATWPEEIRSLAAAFTSKPVHINVGSLELSANPNVKQDVRIMKSSEKKQSLIDLLEKFFDGKRVLIFVCTKKAADDLTTVLRTDGWPARCIHGDKSQSERDWVLSTFRSGKCPIMIATDVASRGLDIPNVRIVINYEFPLRIEHYIHRIGRTARAGQKGKAISFFTPSDKRLASPLVQVLQETGQEVPEALQELEALPDDD